MTLRRKLLSIFFALAALDLVLAAVTVWVTIQWRETNQAMEHHYQRSLALKSVRSLAFRATNELYDGLSGTDSDAREEFEELILPAETTFEQWAALAHTKAEEIELAAVRSTFLQLVSQVREVFDHLAAGRDAEARNQAENDLDDGAFPSFDQVSEMAVRSDTRNRKVIKGEVQNVIDRAEIILTVAALATVTLIMLFAAYLGSDLFGPLRNLYEGLNSAAKGARDIQLDAERQDELGRVNRAYNRLIEQLAERERLAAEGAPDRLIARGKEVSFVDKIVTQMNPRKLLAKLEVKVKQLNSAADSKSVREALLAEIQSLMQTLERVTAFYLPMDLQLIPTDVRRLLYDVAAGFHEELARRGASLAVEVTADVGSTDLDAAKLTEAFSALVRLALNNLPEQNPRLELRATIANGNTALVIEIADNGQGEDQRLMAYDPRTLDKESISDEHLLIEVARAIIERHHGRLDWLIEPGQGTTTRIILKQISSG